MAASGTTPRREGRFVALARHWPRISLCLVPIVLALLHAAGIMEQSVLQRLDDLIFDSRLRATMPRTLDERIVIVDIDEKSLAEVGRWPWPRNRMAQLTQEIFDRQKAALVGFDVVFAEPDDSSGLGQLRRLAREDLRGNAEFAEKVVSLEKELDHDAQFAQTLRGQRVVLGYYFTSDRDGRSTGVLPAPVSEPETTRGLPGHITTWNGYGSNIPLLAAAAPLAGFFNAIADQDGVVRSTPLLAEYHGRLYESLALAMFRRLIGSPTVQTGQPKGSGSTGGHTPLESILLKQEGHTLAIPVDERGTALIPFRGPGTPKGGSYRYHSASDVLSSRLPPEHLSGKIVLVGTTAPGLLDLRATPVNEVYPGVEIHANMISGLLDGRIAVRPDYAMGFEIVVLLAAGITLAIGLPLLTATQALTLSTGVIGVVVALNTWLYLQYGLVLPLASALVMSLVIVVLNMGYGHWVESRSKRELAALFGTYVPPELVDEMVKDPDRYTMQASAQELTVMFCDMRGFTRLSEGMDPSQLQQLLNMLFSRLTRIIRNERGTVDKYMGDCVMAFWGAPMPSVTHATQAVRAALAMAREVRSINEERLAAGEPTIALGIGLHTGLMCVGDMGSDLRRSYTVVGDAVNLGSRLEGLTKSYGVDIVASQATRDQAADFLWQELDTVRVKGREQPVTIYRPLGFNDLDRPSGALAPHELAAWTGLLRSYRAQNWEQCELYLVNLLRMDAQNVLYHLYASRVAARKRLPADLTWDGTTDIETK